MNSNSKAERKQPHFIERTMTRILNEGELTEEEARSYAVEFCEDYYAKGYYNLYSETYRFAKKLENIEDVEYFYRNLERIQECFDKEYSNSKNEKYIEKFAKLCDYITLETARAEMQSAVEKRAENASNQALEQFKKIEKIASDFEESRKESSTQTITVLSIFTGIAMAFFGGFSLLGSAFDNLKYGVVGASILAIIVGIVLFNTVFSFLYIASRLSNRPVSECGHQVCHKCTENMPCNKKEGKLKFVAQLRKKYPYLVFVNMVLIALLVIFTVVSFFTKETGMEEQASSMEHGIFVQEYLQSH